MNFFMRDTGGNLIIAAHHPKWSLTWSWVLVWNLESRFYWYRTNQYLKDKRLYGSVHFWRISITRQPTMAKAVQK